MDTERTIFDLQLTVQRLEEELILHRNGTSFQEVLELVKEKEGEIEAIRLSKDDKIKAFEVELAENAEKLRLLAKNSGEVLMKNGNLQSEIGNMKEHLDLNLKEKAKLESKIDLLTDRDSQMQDKLNQFEHEMNSLRSENSNLAENVEKLQHRCAQLVSDARTRSKESESQKKEIEAKNQLIQQLKHELEKSIRINTELKEKLGFEQKCSAELKARANTSQIALEESQTENASLVSQFDQLQSAHIHTVSEIERLKCQIAEQMEKLDVAIRQAEESSNAEMERGVEIVSLREELIRSEQRIADLSKKLEEASSSGQLIAAPDQVVSHLPEHRCPTALRDTTNLILSSQEASIPSKSTKPQLNRRRPQPPGVAQSIDCSSASLSL